MLLKAPYQLHSAGEYRIVHRVIEPVQLVIGLLEFRYPLGPGFVEDELYVVMAVLELLHGFQRVHDAPQPFTGIRIG